MGDLKENIYYKKTKRLKPILFILLLIFSLIFLITQLIFIYFTFIPEVLQPYEVMKDVQNHIRFAIEKIVIWFIVWPLMYFGIIGAMIYNSMNIQRLINSIDSN